jgi:5'-nucleotidase
MRIAVDLDSTLNVLMPAWLDWYNAHYNDDLTDADITQWDIHELVRPECGARIYDFLRLPGVFSSLPIQYSAAEVMERLCAEHDVRIVTAWSNSSVGVVVDKRAWVQEHLPFFNPRHMIFCCDKSFIDADVLLDDGIHNLEAFRGYSVAYAQPWNAGSGFETVCDWPAFERLIRRQR